jgi:peroxiredoxin
MKYLNLKYLHFLIVVAIIASSCNNKKNNENQQIIIKGILTKSNGLKLVLKELDVRNTLPIDSQVIGSDGSFLFSGILNNSTFLQLGCEGFDPMTLVVAPGDELTITGSPDSLLFATITGSDDSKLLQDYFKETFRNKKKSDALADVLYQSRYRSGFPRIRDSLMKVYDRVVMHQKHYVQKLIRRNPGSLASLIIINQKFGQSVIFDEVKDSVLFFMVDTALSAKHPTNKHTLQHHARMAEKARKRVEFKLALAQLQPGKPAPDFTLRDSDGNSMVLNAFKGKDVLLIFWASWDNECMKELLKLKKEINKLKKNGTEIIGVSFDYKKEMWLSAIQNTGFEWNHVSDFKYPDSPVKTVYCIENHLPVYVLIDKEGIIRARYTNAGQFLKGVE